MSFMNIDDNTYKKLTPKQFNDSTQTSQQQAVKPRKQTTWRKQLFIALIVLLQFLMLVLLVAMLCLMLTYVSTNNNCTCTTGSIGFPNFTGLSDDIIYNFNANVTRSFPNYTEWSDGIVYKVAGSFPNFTELFNVLGQKSLNLNQSYPNSTEQLQIATESAQKLIEIVNTLSRLSHLQNTCSTSTAGVVDNILLMVQELLMLHNDSTALPTSCKKIKETQPNSQSGVYLLANANGGATYATYCNMEELCGTGGGWTRLAYLDMSDSTQSCPSGFRLYQLEGIIEFVVDQQQTEVVVHQFSSHLMVSVTLKCVVE